MSHLLQDRDSGPFSAWIVARAAQGRMQIDRQNAGQLTDRPGSQSARSRRGRALLVRALILGLTAMVVVGTLTASGNSAGTLFTGVAGAVLLTNSGDTGAPPANPAGGRSNRSGSRHGYRVTFHGNFRGLAHRNNPDGSVSLANGGYAIGDKQPNDFAGIPTTITLSIAPGSTPPNYVTIDEFSDDYSARYEAYYTGQTDATGDPVYSLEACEPRALRSGSDVTIFLSNEGVKRPVQSTVSGYVLR